MANKNPSPATRFQPGHDSRGKQKGARDRLSTKFLTALADDFEQNGAKALEEVRTKDPATYMRVCASILPKELEITTRPLDGLNDDQLVELIETLKAVAVDGLRARAHDEAPKPTGTGGAKPH
jgi:hypothetical protein